MGSFTNATFTSGDTIKGVLKLRFQSPETVRNIQMKLEGVSFSRTPIPQSEEERRKNRKESYAIEIHKFLYLTEIVFPPREVDLASTTHQFTLPAGEHAYDFAFKIPDITACESTKQPGALSFSRFVIDNKGIDYARETSSHFSGPLPPALSDMAQIASVRYFLKATVNRTSFMRTNLRIYQPFIYISPDSVEPWRLNEIRYARRQLSVPLGPGGGGSSAEAEQYAAASADSKKSKSKKGFLKSLFVADPVLATVPSLPIIFDMRFPTYVNPLQELPIRLFVIQTSDPHTKTMPTLYLDSLTFKLYATTDTRSQTYVKRHTHSVTLLTQADMMVALPPVEFDAATLPTLGQVWEVELPRALWQNVRIPDTVAPSFRMCNITRNYSFEVVAGFVVVPGEKPRFVSVIGEIQILSGIAGPALPGRSGSSSSAAAAAAAPPPPFPMRPGQQSTDDAPPAYTDVVPAASSSAASPPSTSKAPDQRRTYHHSDDYFASSQIEELERNEKR